MTSPQQMIESDLKDALRAGDKEKLSTLRMLLAEVNNERIRRGSEVDAGAFVGLVRKAIKRRQEAAEQYRQGRISEDLQEQSERFTHRVSSCAVHCEAGLQARL